jgi:hypothetical protein
MEARYAVDWCAALLLESAALHGYDCPSVSVDSLSLRAALDDSVDTWRRNCADVQCLIVHI